MRNVTEVMIERLTNAGLEVPEEAHPAHAAVGAIAGALDAVIPTVSNDPLSLRIVIEALRAYADVAEDYATAQQSR